MARDRDRDDADRFDDEPELRSTDMAAARRKVAAPAVILVLFGLLGLALGLLTLAVSLAAPAAFGEMFVNAMRPLVERQPAQQARNDQLAQLEQLRQLRMDTPLNLGSAALSIFVSALLVVGGLRMKGLHNYGLAVTASVAALYPCGSCVCLAAPFGVWALIVLLNPGVKAAFAARRETPLSTDDE